MTLPMDLEQHIRTAIREETQLKMGWLLGEGDASTAIVRGISRGIANWLLQRDAHMANPLSSWPSEVLERASVMLMTAAIEAAKRENK